MNLSEFKSKLFSKDARYTPSTDIFGDYWEDGMGNEFLSRRRKFVYEEISNEAHRRDLLNEWWAQDHPEFYGGEYFGSRIVLDEKNVEAAQEVIDEFNDFAFRCYTVTE